MTSITRRSFVAATAGAIAVPNLPARGDGAFPQRPLADDDFYYLHRGEHHLCSLSDEPRISGNPFDEDLKPGGQRKTTRRRFLPLGAAARFIVVTLEWEHTIGNYPESYKARGFDERQQAFDRMYVAAKSRDLPEPESFVAVPPGLVQTTEHDWNACPRLTREAALHAAAEANRETWNAMEAGDDFEGMYWNVVVELGEPCEAAPGVIRVEFAESGVGVMTENRDIPVRVVIPTAAELARYAIGCEVVKGGA